MPALRRAAALTLAVTLLGCGVAPLPTRLGGLRRVRVWTGQRAARMVTQLHGRQVTAADSTIAQYGRTGELRVWLTRYPDGIKAAAGLKAMLAGLRSGRTPFARPQELPDQPGRWFTVGPGGHHALWVSGSVLYWVEGQPERVQRAVEELPAPSTGLWT